MKMKEFFKFDRFILISRQGLEKNVSQLLVLWGAVALIIACSTVIFGLTAGNARDFSNFSAKQYMFNIAMFYALLYIIGLQFCSMAFPELKTKETRYSWLLLPGSIFEKFFSRLLFTSLVFFIFYTIAYFIGAFVGATLNVVFFDFNFTVINPFNSTLIKTLIMFFALHAIFFTGGLYFKKLASIKTLAIILLLFLLLIAMFIFFTWFFYLNNDVSVYYANNLSSFMGVPGYTFITSLFKICSNIIFFVIIPLFSWFIGYYKLKEIGIQ